LNQAGTTTNSYLYTGQQFDSLTGLYDLRARYYDPALGRFLSQDTYPYNSSNPVELNRYTYAGNNPVNRFDPSGHMFIETAINYAKSIKNVAVTYGIGAAVTYTYLLALNTPWIVTGLLIIGGTMEGYLLYRAVALGDQDAAFALATGYMLTNYSYSALADLVSRLWAKGRSSLLLWEFINKRLGTYNNQVNCLNCALRDWQIEQGLSPVDDLLQGETSTPAAFRELDDYLYKIRTTGVDPVETSLKKHFIELSEQNMLKPGDIVTWHNDLEITFSETGPITTVNHAGIYAGNDLVFSKMGWLGGYTLQPIISPSLSSYGEIHFWTRLIP
jgi:RHS repeat-associated protein